MSAVATGSRDRAMLKRYALHVAGTHNSQGAPAQVELARTALMACAPQLKPGFTSIYLQVVVPFASVVHVCDLPSNPPSEPAAGNDGAGASEKDRQPQNKHDRSHRCIPSERFESPIIPFSLAIVHRPFGG